jgi:hypothetical protein
MKRRELDPWIEGDLDYLSGVRCMNRRTIADVRCTLKGSRPSCPRMHQRDLSGSCR